MGVQHADIDHTGLTGISSGAVATDAIWDAAGDLAVGSGANTAARLAKGAAGANLSTYNGVVAWNGGTSFPASPATGDRYWRSDLGLEAYFDGTRWLTTQEYMISDQIETGLTVDANIHMPLTRSYQVYLTTWDVLAFVTASATWVISLQSLDVENNTTVLDSYSTAGQTANEFYLVTQTLGDVLDATAAHAADLIRGLKVTYDEQSGSATFFGGTNVRYRLILT